MMDGNGSITEVSITNNPDYLARLRLIVACHADCAGMDSQEAYDAKLAVTEACANAILHGSPRQDMDRIVVRLSSAGGAVVAEVTDTGEGFDPSDVQPHCAERAGGRGIPLMRSLTDEVEFSQLDNGMTVRLVKRAKCSIRSRRRRVR